MGDAWLDKLDEISQLYDEISIDIEVLGAFVPSLTNLQQQNSSPH